MFGSFRLDRDSYRLSECVPGEPERQIALRPKAFDILRYLVENAGRIISQDEFLAQLWTENYVQPEVLKSHVLAVRTALADRASPARYIETVRGRGYRFVADVRVLPAQVEAGAGSTREGLAGRTQALAELAQGLARADAGEAQLIVVTGEPGIGKTALVEAFALAAAQRDALVATGHCLPGSGQTDAYYPILEIVSLLARGARRDRVVSLLTRYAPTWLVQLPTLLPAGLGELRREVIDATPHRMAREFCDLLDELSRDVVLFILLEDLHWADRATLDLLHALASRRMRARLIIVTTLRTSISTETGRSAATLAQTLALYRLAREVRLEALAPTDVEAFLRGLTSAPVPPALIRHLHARSEGNPLFMRAILDSLLQNNLVSFDAGGWQLEATFESLGLRAPPSLAQIIEAEIHDLPSRAQSVLEAGSIADGSFSPVIHCAAAAMDEQAFETICESLSRQGHLIRRSDLIAMPDGRLVPTYVFHHAIFQEVAYDRQGALRRAQGHGAIAARLTELYATDLAQIASKLVRHCTLAARWPEAVRYLRVTARTAVQRFALREAAALLEQAIALSRNLADGEREEAELGSLEELGRIYVGTQDLRGAAIYERLAQLANELRRVDVEARALLGWGYVVSWSDGERCLQIMSRALAKILHITDRVQSARLRSHAHGWRCYIQGWNAVDAQGVVEAVEELRLLNDPVAFAASRLDHSTILFPSARYLESIEAAQSGFDVLVSHALDTQVDLSLPLWMIRLGVPWALMSAGRFGEALQGFAAGYAAFEANGEVGRATTLRLFHAFVHLRMHDHRAALDMLDETLVRMRDQGTALQPNETKIEMVLRGLAELGIGETQAALGHLATARAEMKRRTTLTSWYWRLAADWGMTDAHLAMGNSAAAETSAQEFLACASAGEERTWRALAAEACARLALSRGDTTTAGAHLAHAWVQIEGYDTPLVRWRLHAVQALLAQLSGESERASRHRRYQQEQLAALAASLPHDHRGRLTLQAAQPLLVRAAAQPRGQKQVRS